MKDKIRPLIGLQRVPLHENIPLDTPFSVYIFPTNYCNFRCKYCAHSLPDPAFREQYGFSPEAMSMEVYRAAIDQITDFPGKVKTISLTGQGEPLMNRHLPEMVAYAKERKAANRVEFMSNGALLNRNNSAALVEAGLDCIRISLQGLNSRKYRDVCGARIDFDDFVSQIAWLYDHKKQCEVFVKIMDIALEPGEEDRFYELFSPIADRVYIEQCRPVYSGVSSTEGISTQADRYGREHKKRSVCPLCFFMLGIFPNGDVYPCETIYRPELLGNVMQDRLVDLWNSEKMHSFQLRQLTEGKNANPRCALCCAPDDVSQPEDELDEYAEELIGRLKEKWS